MDARPELLTLSTSLSGWMVQGRSFCAIVVPTPLPLWSLLQQVTMALESKLYYAALAMVFTLPDICVTLEGDPNRPFSASSKSFRNWFDRNASRFFLHVKGEDFCRMRCGLLHNGQFGHSKSSYDRIVFLIPGSSFQGHDVVITFCPDVKLGGRDMEQIMRTIQARPLSGRVLLLDVVKLCQTVMRAVEIWSLSKIDDKNFRINVEMMSYHRPQGIPPLFVGVPVIA